MTDTPNKPTLLITGGAKRLGRGIALAAAAQGYNVAVHYRKSASEALALTEALRESGVASMAVEADLSDPGAAGPLIAEVRDTLGPVDLLVNSASIFRESRLMDFSLSELEAEIRVNAFSPLLLCRQMGETGRAGAIVNLLDSRMNSYDKTHVAYHLSKRMLYDITRMLAIELAPTVRVNAVAPGLILPPVGADAQYLETHKGENPLHRHGSVEEIADAVLFLARSPFVTGQVLFVDGGRHLNSSVYG
jgi:pteridine reductase